MDDVERAAKADEATRGPVGRRRVAIGAGVALAAGLLAVCIATSPATADPASAPTPSRTHPAMTTGADGAARSVGADDADDGTGASRTPDGASSDGQAAASAPPGAASPDSAPASLGAAAGSPASAAASAASPTSSGTASSAARPSGSGGSASSASATTPGGSPSSGPSSPAPAPAAHAHAWVERTHEEPVYDQRWVVDQAAWDEPIYETQYYCVCDDGAEFLDPHAASMHVGETGGGYSTRQRQVQTGSVHHDEAGHYESVQTGTRTVSDGYVCTGCGATK